MKDQAFRLCPHCHAEIKANAKACPECGSDENTGWAKEADSWDFEEADYEHAHQREFGEDSHGKKTESNWGIALVAITLLVIWIISAIL